MNTICRFFVDQEGWFITNQNLGTKDPFTVGRDRERYDSITMTFDELARSKDWAEKNHGGDVLSTLIGGLGNLTDRSGVSWLCVNFNRFRFEVREGVDRDQAIKIAKMILQITMRECLGLPTEEVDSTDNIFSDEDRARLEYGLDVDEDDDLSDPFADHDYLYDADDLNDELAEQVDPNDE